MRLRPGLMVMCLLVGAVGLCWAAGWNNMLKDHKDFLRMVEPSAPRVKRMADAYIVRHGFQPEQLAAAVFVWGCDGDEADWCVDYWHAPPQENYPNDYPQPDMYPSDLTVYIGKVGRTWHKVHRPIPQHAPPSNQYLLHADEVARQRGYDPAQYQRRLWYFGRWNVDYWAQGTPSADFLEPPTFVIHLAYPRHHDMRADELEIPVDPRMKNAKKKK